MIVNLFFTSGFQKPFLANQLSCSQSQSCSGGQQLLVSTILYSPFIQSALKIHKCLGLVHWINVPGRRQQQQRPASSTTMTINKTMSQQTFVSTYIEMFFLLKSFESKVHTHTKALRHQWWGAFTSFTSLIPKLIVGKSHNCVKVN